jgi:hypothetical protein
MKKYLLILPLIVLLFACTKNEVKKVSFSPAEQEQNIKTLYNLFKKEYTYADRNALANLGLPLKVVRDTVKNIHEPDLIDSVFTYNYKDIEVHFLKSNAYNKLFHTCTCIKRNIETKGFSIALNSSKEEIESIFGKTEMTFTDSDSTIICYEFGGDDEETVATDQVTFVFVGNKLTEINYMPYVD